MELTLSEFTLSEVMDWIGSDTSRAEIIDIIKDIANGNYEVELLKEDIRSYVR